MTRQRGFTLIEIVVAFVLLGLVLGVSYELFSTGMRRAGDLDDYSRALAVAQSRLAESSVGEIFPEGQTQGESEDRKFQWTLTVSPYFEAQQDPARQVMSAYYPVRLAVRVSWRSAAEVERHLDLATLVVGKTQ